MSKKKAAIRDAVSPYPSKISKRLAYFILKHGHGISGLPSGKIQKNTAGQIKSRVCHFFSLQRRFEKFTFYNVWTGSYFTCNKTPFGYQ